MPSRISRKTLQRDVGAADRSRLEQYFTSVRDLEHRLQESREWERKAEAGGESGRAARDRQSRAVHGQGEGHVRPGAARVRDRLHARHHAHVEQRRHAGASRIPGETITDSYHNLSHHGKTEEKLAQLKVLDEWHMKLLANLFGGPQGSERGRRAARWIAP